MYKRWHLNCPLKSVCSSWVPSSLNSLRATCECVCEQGQLGHCFFCLFVCLFVCLFFQQCACQIPKWCGHLHYQSRGFETSQDLMIIRQDFTTGVHCIQPVCLSARTSASPRVRSVAPTVLGGFFLYLAHIITSIRGTWNDSWPGPISSRSFSRDYSKTAKTWHMLSCPLHNTLSSGWIPSIFGTNSMRWRIVHIDLWPRPISSRSFSHDFTIKLLRYSIFFSCPLHTSYVKFWVDLFQIWHK